MAILQLNSYENKNNTLKSTLIGAGVAAAGGAYAGLVTANPLKKNGSYKDEFIHNIIKTPMTDKADRQFADFARDVNNIGAHPTGEDIKFVQKYIADNAKDLDLIDLVDPRTSEKTNIFKYIEDVKTGYKENVATVKENLEKVFDTKKKVFKKLSEDASEDVVEFADTAKKALFKMQTKKALKYAGVGVLVGGVASFISNKIAEKL